MFGVVRVSRGMKWTLGIVLGIVVLMAGLYCALRFGFGIDVLDRSGWYEEDGQRRYLDYYGDPMPGWQIIDGSTYFFNENGAPQTGWGNLGGKDYYFHQDGTLADGWVDTPRGRFLLDPNGAAIYGWHRDAEGMYYLQKDSGLTVGWMELEGQKYYFDDRGIMLTGWQVLDGKDYCFDPSGPMLTGWAEREEGRSYLSADGGAVTGWLELDGKKYCFDEAGMLITGFYSTAAGTYLFDPEGAMLTGVVNLEDGRAYFDESGIMQTGWVQLEGKQYYFSEAGMMHTGWLEDGTDRYYFREDGSMAVGEVEIDGVSNFFTSKGKYVVLVNAWHLMPEDYQWTPVTVEGYEFDVSGAEALKRMLEDCRKAGYGCNINNTYRSKATQQYMWDVRIEQRMAEGMTRDEAIAFIGQSLARVGASEHHLGLAVDLDGSDAMEAWMAEHCWDYGFILRYPNGTTAMTGIIYEPWHFRYVGTELSLELKELGLCMEAYMDMLTSQSQ